MNPSTVQNSVLAPKKSNIHRLDSTTLTHPFSVESRYYATHYEKSFGVSWLYFKKNCPKRFTQELVKDLRDYQINLEQVVKSDLVKDSPINYHVISSSIPKTFSLGGDLEFFSKTIRRGDKNSLTQYARNCIDLVYSNASHYKLPMTTISLVQGNALGGGFEAALANDVVIAEKQCTFGLPEILFNMFPGMGAYQLLCRRIPEAKAKKIILSGRTYSAQELYDLGVVDELVEEGEGENAVWNYIRDSHGSHKGRAAFFKAIETATPLNYNSFIHIVDAWVEAALELDDHDLKTMDFLVRAQRRLE